MNSVSYSKPRDVSAFGTEFLRLRLLRGLSQRAISKASGVSQGTISRWEAGETRPSIPELEAVLGVIRPGKSERVALLERISAPRALSALTNDLSDRPIVGGDLLRAMRNRRGMSQGNLATVLGINQATLAKWEAGSDWPSAERLHHLCFALGAGIEEVTALTTGLFLPADAADAEIVGAQLPESLGDLICLSTIGRLIAEAPDSPVRLARLSGWRLRYANFLTDRCRYSEALRQAEAALELCRGMPELQNDALTAAIYRAQALVQRSPKNLTPACRFLARRVNEEASPGSLGDIGAWLLADLATYFARLGRRDESRAATRLSEQISFSTEGAPHVWTCAYFARIHNLNGDLDSMDRWMALWRSKGGWTEPLELRYALLDAQRQGKAGRHEEARTIAFDAVSRCSGPLLRYRPEALGVLECIMFS